MDDNKTFVSIYRSLDVEQKANFCTYLLRRAGVGYESVRSWAYKGYITKNPRTQRLIVGYFKKHLGVDATFEQLFPRKNDNVKLEETK